MSDERNDDKEQTKNADCATSPTAARIRDLNDRFRTTGRGGKTLLTDGVIGLDPELAVRVLDAVKGFEDFGPDNDPWDEHDCASLQVDGVNIIWKIDYYERSGRIHSPDPSDQKVTLRVLTIMLAEEY